jgi:PAS domain S-box-containing protein
VEDTLENWEERYNQLLELCPDLISIVVEGKIASINTAGLKLLGATEPGQLVGRSLLDLILPTYRKSAMERFRQIAEEGRLPLVEEKWIKLDGTVIDVEVTAAPLKVQDKPAIQLIARDITRPKRAEEVLRESEDRHRRLMELYLDLIGVETARTAELHAAVRRAREVDELKSQLLSTVSHELRTPLTAIRGQTSTLLDYTDQMTHAEQIEALRIVDEEAARLDELISHLLDMSRIESGMLRVEPVATDLRPILQETIDLIAVQAPHHILSTDLPPELPLAQADPRRVRQIMSNLLDNAVKFSSQGTTITVCAQSNGTAISISVHDEGQGIAPEHLPHIFDRFYRGEGLGVQTGGVGLGLAICKGLVEAMGGRISVVSQVGQGSTFSFSLPLTQGVSEYGED